MAEKFATVHYLICRCVAFSTGKSQIRFKGRSLAALYFVCSRWGNCMKHSKGSLRNASLLEGVVQFDHICCKWFSIVFGGKMQVWLMPTELVKPFFSHCTVRADPFCSPHRSLLRTVPSPSHAPCLRLERMPADPGQKYTKQLNNVDDHMRMPELKTWMV